jgi:VanZ family protein
MLVIFVASTELGSAKHTSRLLLPVLRWLIPNVDLATLASAEFIIRKAAHITEYAILGALLLRAFSTNASGRRWRYAALAIGVAAAFAALDEFHQSFVSTRTGSPSDVLIDICGAVLGLACVDGVLHLAEKSPLHTGSGLIADFALRIKPLMLMISTRFASAEPPGL